LRDVNGVISEKLPLPEIIKKKVKWSKPWTEMSSKRRRLA